MILTQRLLKIAEMVRFRRVADIGTDHAKLPVYLIQNKISDKVIASDIAKGPVKSCECTVSRFGMSEFIDIRQGNGLLTLHPSEVETIVIAGMGGDLISSIMENGEEIAKSAKEIILQPMTHIPQLRNYLKDANYKVIEEVLVKEKEKHYTIIKVVSGENQYKDEFDFLISPILIQNKDKLLAEYILKLLNKFKSEIEGLKKASVSDENLLISNQNIVSKLERLYEIAKNY